jgi:hypothetical protein
MEILVTEPMKLVDAIRHTILSAADGDEQSILLLGAIYILLVCSYSVVWQMRMNLWPKVTGRLEELGLRKFGSTKWAITNQEYVSDALYTYRVGGKEYAGKRVSPWVMVATHSLGSLLRLQQKGVDVGRDNEVTVYYNPGNPAKSFLVRTGPFSQMFTALIGVGPLVFYLATY